METEFFIDIVIFFQCASMSKFFEALGNRDLVYMFLKLSKEVVFKLVLLPGA